MVSKEIQNFIKGIGKAEATQLGREMLDMRAQGVPDEVVDDVFKKRLGLIEEKVEVIEKIQTQPEIKDTLNKILDTVIEQKEGLKSVKEEVRNVKQVVNGINLQPYNVDLPAIGPADLGIKIDAPVDLGKGQNISSSIDVKSEVKKDDTSSIIEKLRQMKGK